MERAFGLEIPSALDETCHPGRTALIVYDMQAGIVSQLATAPTVVARAQEVLRGARAGGFRVFFTRHLSLPNSIAGVTQLRRAKAWQGAEWAAATVPAFPRDSPQFQIIPELGPLPDEAIVDKITMFTSNGPQGHRGRLAHFFIASFLMASFTFATSGPSPAPS